MQITFNFVNSLIIIRVVYKFIDQYLRFLKPIYEINENGIHQKQDDFAKNLECFIFIRMFYNSLLDWDGFGFNELFCSQLILFKGTLKVYSAVD